MQNWRKKKLKLKTKKGFVFSKKKEKKLSTQLKRKKTTPSISKHIFMSSLSHHFQKAATLPLNRAE